MMWAPRLSKSCGESDWVLRLRLGVGFGGKGGFPIAFAQDDGVLERAGFVLAGGTGPSTSLRMTDFYGVAYATLLMCTVSAGAITSSPRASRRGGTGYLIGDGKGLASRPIQSGPR
jgi:hypothetical protein